LQTNQPGETFSPGIAFFRSMNVLAILALPFLAALPVDRADSVTFSLFSLFKPEALEVRLAAGDNAIVDAAGLTANRSITRGESIKIRVSGSRLNMVVSSSNGSINNSLETGRVRIEPDTSARLELILPGKIKRIVRGTLEIDTGSGGRGPLRILLITDRESAVASVVGAETVRRETAALMAIAVVVRTFMHSHTGRHSSEGFDFCDTTHCQLYRGEQDLSDRVGSPAVWRAVADTSGQVLRFEGRPVEGYYTAACGGLSVTPSMVWGGVTNYRYTRIACGWCERSRFSRWQRAARVNDILDSLSGFLKTKVSPATVLITKADPESGFVQSVSVRDGDRSIVLSPDSFRRAIGLRLGWNTVLSPTFTVERRGSRFIFRGRGFGSQVGLCEEGAIAQASAGRGYREILSFYYPGAEIVDRTSNE
jgi:SpoIID/LytB domain